MTKPTTFREFLIAVHEHLGQAAPTEAMLSIADQIDQGRPPPRQLFEEPRWRYNRRLFQEVQREYSRLAGEAYSDYFKRTQTRADFIIPDDIGDTK